MLLVPVILIIYIKVEIINVPCSAVYSDYIYIAEICIFWAWKLTTLFRFTQLLLMLEMK